MMNAHEQLHSYLRDSIRNDSGSIKNAFELSLEAEKHYAELKSKIIDLQDKIASQANMIDKLQVKAGHIDLLRGLLCDVMCEYQCAESVAVQFSDGKCQTDYHALSARMVEALEQTKET